MPEAFCNTKSISELNDGQAWNPSKVASVIGRDRRKQDVIPATARQTRPEDVHRLGGRANTGYPHRR